MQKTLSSQRYSLKDSPFYKLESKKRLADLLRISEPNLKSLVKRNDLYLRRWKHKKLNEWKKERPIGQLGDSFRPIDIPDPRLKALQSRIANLLARIEPPDFLFSPVKGRSYVENAALHKDSVAFWMLDVADYFPSCTANAVAGFFLNQMKCSPDVTAILVKLTTLNSCLPQGSPCSPILAYYCNSEMWTEVAAAANSSGCTLSLYADDITISGRIVRKELIWRIKKLIHKSGLRLKKVKEVSLIHSPADITGVIVKDGRTLLPNRQMKKLSELKSLRSLANNPKERRQLENKIAGRIAQKRQVETP